MLFVACNTPDTADSYPPSAYDNRPPSLGSLLEGVSGYREDVQQDDVDARNRDPDICTIAAQSLHYTCGYDYAFDVNEVRCANSYEGCEAYCVAATPCDAFYTFGNNDDHYKRFNTCRTSCYAEGPATCQEAEQRMRCENQDKAVRLYTQKNPDGYCNAQETCEANCDIMTPYAADIFDTPRNNRHKECVHRCAIISSLLYRSLFYDTGYCTQYPNSAHCEKEKYCINEPTSDLCITKTQDSNYDKTYKCLLYPLAKGCTPDTNQTVTTQYCATSDGLKDPKCAVEYCKTQKGIADKRCRKQFDENTCPPKTEEPVACYNACSDPISRGCELCICRAWPALCSGTYTNQNDWCDYYSPYSARECDEDAWCAYHPGEGGCPN